MKQSVTHILLAAGVVGLLGACTASRQSEAGRVITATPLPCVLTPDSANRIDMDLTFHVPARYLSKRARLIIVPQLVTGDTVRDEYTPLVVDAPVYGKKTTRREVLDGYADPYRDSRRSLDDSRSAFTLSYKESAVVSEDIRAARIRAVVTEDGCGECSGIDTVDVAAVSLPIEPDVKKDFKLVWMEPEFVVRPKIREGRGEAHLQFAINQYLIDPALGNNRAELDSMVATLQPVLEDSLATVTSLDIYGMASADGSYAYNAALARNRAASARRWLQERVDIRPQVERLISVGSRPEGWWPVYEAMRADGHPDSLEVKRIIETYTEGNDDVQERYIRALPCWNDIRTNYLQKDRKVVYTYTYTLRSFTDDAELLDMYTRRPDAFNEDELLRVAVLMKGDEERMMEVYRTIQHYFPQNQVAANNLAVLYMRRGETDKARRALDVLESYDPEVLNTLAACYVYADDYERAVELLRDAERPQPRYNLGLLKAKQRKLDEAYALLRPYADVNSAIAALSVNRNEEARDVMMRVDDDSPVAEYVRSLAAARLGDADALFLHLAPACADPGLKARAGDEADFDPYRADPRFDAALKN